MGVLNIVRHWMGRELLPQQTKDAPPFLGLITSKVDEQYGIADPALLKDFKGLGWVYTCMHKIASSLTSLPLLVKQTKRGGEPELVEGQPVNALFDMINPLQGTRGLLYLSVFDLLIGGDCYWYKNLTGNPKAPISEVWRLDPKITRVVPGGDWITGYVQKKGGKEKRYDVEEVSHFFPPNPFNPFYGLSPTEAVALAAATDKATGEANLDFAAKGFAPDWFIELASGMGQDEEQMRAMQRRIDRGFDNKQHHVHLVAPGTKLTPANLAPREMEFEALRRMNREEICGVYGVPPPTVGILDRGTYANYEEANRAFWGDTVRFWATLIEQQLAEDFLPHFGDGLIAEFDLSVIDALQDSDLDDKERALEEVKTGILTPNQYLDIFYPDIEPQPAEIGDITYMPISMIPGGGSVAAPEVEETVEEAARRLLSTALGEVALKRPTVKVDEHKFPTGIRGDRIWKQFDLQVQTLAHVMQRRVEDLIKQQAAGVRDRMNLRGKAVIKDAAEDFVAYVVFDEVTETVLWQQALTPFQEEALRLGGINVLAEIDIGVGISFDVATPEIAEYLLERKQIFKTIVGNRADELRASLLEGYRADETITELGYRVDEYGTDAGWKSDRIARTEIHSTMNAGRHQGLKQAGAEFKEWIATRDSRVRDAHAALDGTAIPIDDNFISPTGQGPHPGEMGNAADDINCRCTEGMALEVSK